MIKQIESGYIDQPQSTEFGQKQELLAVFLYQMNNGDPWTEVDDSYRFNYRLDAAEILLSQPHLLTLDERERLAPQYPEVSA